MRSLDDAPFLDLFDEGFQADPASVTDALRARSAVARTAVGCVVLARDHVHALLSDPRLRSALLPMVQLQGVAEGPVFDAVASSILALDGDDHARLRRLVSRSFTPRAIDPHRAIMRNLVDDLVGTFAASGRCEFMSDFADHYPIQVICHLLGVPKDDHELFARWGDELTHVLSFELSARVREVSEAMAGLNGYLLDLIADRHARPRDDLVSQLVEASVEGDRLSPTELRSLLAGLLFAGYDTTRNQLGLAMTLFCAYPTQWRLLAAQPDLAGRAVEEVMRVAPATAVTVRLATEDVEVDGWHIPAGTLVSLSLAAANYDPAAFVDPHGFDITADRETQLTFGGGPHFCLGANLARAEMQEALPILARRLADVELDGDPDWRPRTGIYGPNRLPLRFTPTAA